jgi:hypothetical protein
MTARSVCLVGFSVLILGAYMTFPSPARAGELDGVWRSDGYGFLLEIDGKRLRLFETTAVSCIPSMTALLVDSTAPRAEAAFKIENAPVTFYVTAGPTPDVKCIGAPFAASTMLCRRLDRRPEILNRKAENTPVANFDVFWATYAENYPFFVLHGTDWTAVREKYRPRVTATTTPEQLFDILREMIEPFHDAHTFLNAPLIKKRYGGTRPNPHPLGIKDQARATEIIKKHIQGELRSGCNNQLAFGELTDSVGYLRIKAFAGYGGGGDFDKGAEALETALDKALADAAKWRGLVIDVRQNGGGSDVYGVMVASRLTSREYLAFAKKARNDPNDTSKFTPLQPMQARVGRKPRFEGKVVLLTGPNSVSAAETFTMALMGRTPAVTRIGEHTQGVFSDVLGRRLPNGWRFGLPNEIFVSENGQAFDGPGIPPDIAVPVFSKEDLEKGRDGALEKALEVLAKEKP